MAFALYMHLLLLCYAIGFVEMSPETYMGIQLILLWFVLSRSFVTTRDIYKAYKYDVPSADCECQGCQWRA